MKAQEEIKVIETELINRLCWIPDPEIILPHMVFIEDVNEKGEPEYYHCTLEAINQEEQTCTLLNHSNGERSANWGLTAINIDWLVTLWDWYKEKHAEDEDDTELLYLAESGEWHERAISLMSEYTEADDEAIRDYAAEHWQNLRSDKDNLAEFREYLKDIEPTNDYRSVEEIFHPGDIVCLTESATTMIKNTFDSEAADYRKDMVLEIQSMRQDPNTHLWHITVRDIFEDDDQEFLSCYLRPIIQKENWALLADTSSKPSEKELFAYVFPSSRLERNATDAEILADYNSGHEKDELTIKLTPDEFAAYCNDGFFNDLNQYVRFI